MAADFTLDGYRALLEAFFAWGYEARGFDDAEPTKRHLIVRHDLDMSIQAALPIAELERKMGVTATYFVLLRSELYNPFSAAGRGDLGRLLKLGQRIGLHFDASLYGQDRDSLDRAAEKECAVLETIMGCPIAAISLHRPAKSLQGVQGTLGGRRHALEPRFFSEMGYCSDSRGGWHYGHPLDHPAVTEGRALQLVTHPIWWVYSAADPPAKLVRFLDQRVQFLDQELAAHCSVHKPNRHQP